MVIKISCKYIKDNAFDITVGQETHTITHENKQAVLSWANQKITILKFAKSLAKAIILSVIFWFSFHYDIARHFQYSIDEHRFKVV